MTIEKLTEDTRYRLDQIPDGRKAIGIIDAQSVTLAETRAECERFRAQAESWERGHDYAWAEKAKAEARAEALQARVAELEDAVGWERALKDALLPYQERAVAAESELATAKARAAELEAEKEHAVKRAAEAELRFEDAVKVAMGRASAETVARLREESATRLAYSEQWRSEALESRAKLAAAESELADLRGRVGRALAAWDPIKRHYQVPMHLCTELEALRGR